MEQPLHCATIIPFSRTLQAMLAAFQRNKPFDPRRLLETSSTNPWHYAGTMSIAEGQLNMGIFGMWHLTVLQFYLVFGFYPVFLCAVVG